MLSFSVDDDRQQVFVHLDLEGVQLLIRRLQRIEQGLTADDCPHEHLFSDDWSVDGDLTGETLDENGRPPTSVHHVKMYGWTTQWKAKHFGDGRN